MKKNIETKYLEATIYVTDNGYTIRLRDYRGPSDLNQGIYVAKTLDEVKKILQKNFISLKS